MYCIAPSSQQSVNQFHFRFEGKLSSENRWVTLAQLVPWDEFESLRVHSSPLGAYKPRSTQSAILPEISNRTYPPRNHERQTIWTRNFRYLAACSGVVHLAFMPNITKSGHEPIVSGIQIYDSRANRKAIFNRGMVPNIPENPRGRKTPKRGRKPIFDPAIFQERFQTIERVFAWEDKFRRLLLRFERISQLHYALKSLAYTMINLRHFCQP